MRAVLCILVPARLFQPYLRGPASIDYQLSRGSLAASATPHTGRAPANELIGRQKRIDAPQALLLFGATALGSATLAVMGRSLASRTARTSPPVLQLKSELDEGDPEDGADLAAAFKARVDEEG